MAQDPRLGSGCSETNTEEIEIAMEMGNLDAATSVEHREEVFLRIYDISNGMAKLISPQLLGFQIDGVWHTSIEIFGKEYYFQDGLSVQKAGATQFNVCTERTSLGFTSCTQKNLLEFLECGRESWRPESYNIIENNCNDFTNWLANFLVDKNIPDHILDLPKKVKNTDFFKLLMNRRM